MTTHEIYEIWAPTESEWSQWVKPVLFAHLLAYGNGASSVDRQEIAAVSLPHNDGQSALVLDLPGAMAVQMTGDLVRQRYLPPHTALQFLSTAKIVGFKRRGPAFYGRGE